MIDERQIDDSAATGVKAMALVLAEAFRDALSRPGRGKLYKRGKGRNHRASRPFETPAPDTGNLVRSVFMEQLPNGNYAVGVSADYAELLEFGTMHMAPRPFMVPAVRLAEKQMDMVLESTLRTESAKWTPSDPQGGR